MDKALLINAKRTAKFGLILCLVLTVLAARAYPRGKAPFRPKLSLKLTGGWSSIPIGDMNTILTSFNSLPHFEYWRANYPDLISGEIRTLNTKISDWRLEFRLDISPKIGVAIGTSLPYKKGNEGTIDWTMTEGQRHLFTLRPMVQVAPPILWSVYYGLITSPRLRVSMNVGLGMYVAKLSEYYKLEVFPPGFESDWGVRYWESNFCSAPGFHTGIEIDFQFTRLLAFVLEAELRYARITNFSGHQYREGKYFGITDRESGSIYYYTRLEFYTGDRYADIQVMEPPGNGIEIPRHIRRAVLDLSGSSLRLGIMFRLF
jgi:hypothetical protein